jgi:hypothetical protein
LEKASRAEAGAIRDVEKPISLARGDSFGRAWSNISRVLACARLRLVSIREKAAA